MTTWLFACLGLVLSFASCQDGRDTSGRLHNDHDASWGADSSVDDASAQDASGSLPDSGGHGSDAGSVCTALDVNNKPGGVGALCTHNARELACPTTKVCLQGLAMQGLAASPPYYCTKDCSQTSECGESARCCKPKGWPRKICVLDSCQALCE